MLILHFQESFSLLMKTKGKRLFDAVMTVNLEMILSKEIIVAEISHYVLHKQKCKMRYE